MAKKTRVLSSEDKAALPYRPCVGTLVVNAQGLVWAGRRLPNEEYTDQTLLWQFPQGGIDEGEDAEKAALRELYEETSIKSVSSLVEIEGWLTYDLPEELIGTALKGKYRGQKQRWFVFSFEGDDSEINVLHPPEGEEAEFDHWEWMYLEDVPALTVPFKVELYQTLIDRLRGHASITWK
ncbi:MAG: RNA pyrophosphohydrolase [Pseudomonadota bacterium]